MQAYVGMVYVISFGGPCSVIAAETASCTETESSAVATLQLTQVRTERNPSAAKS